MGTKGWLINDDDDGSDDDDDHNDHNYELEKGVII